MFSGRPWESAIGTPNSAFSDPPFQYLMQIFIQTLIGKTITVEVEAFHSVGELKDKIQVAERIPINQQRLIFNGRQLNDAGSLSSYFIKKESTLQLLFSLRGGGYPQYILKKATELDDEDETIESMFFPLYDKILNYWFPPSEGFDVSPQWTVPESIKTASFTVTFVIQHHRKPLLLVEVKPPSDFHVDSGREEAIIEVMRRLDEIGPTNQHVDRLYAISAIGKKWRACYCTKGNGSKGGQPARGITAVSSLRSASPEYWNPDITSDDSYIALQGIVDTIKGYIA